MVLAMFAALAEKNLVIRLPISHYPKGLLKNPIFLIDQRLKMRIPKKRKSS